VTSTAPLSTLRGAGVDVDPRRAASAVVALCLLALAVSASVLFVAGARRNSQISDLRTRGVPVAVRVTSCLGQLGGSGSNPIGYSCTGTYTVAGRRFTATVPDDALHAPGTIVRGVVASDDPALLSTPRILAGERASSRVFVLPAVLTGVLALGLVVLGWCRHRRAGRPIVGSAEPARSTTAGATAAPTGPAGPVGPAVQAGGV